MRQKLLLIESLSSTTQTSETLQPVMEELQNIKNEQVYDVCIRNSEPESIRFIDYWKGFLDFGYYCLIIPFRLTKSPTSRHHRLEMHSCRLQQILCGIVQIVLLFDFVSLFWLTYWEASGESNIGYFTSLTYVGYVAYHLCLNYTFWARKSTFSKLFNQLQNLKFYADHSRKRTKLFIRIFSVGFCLIIILMAMTESSLVNNFYRHGNILVYIDYLSQTAQRHFLFTKSNETVKLSEFLQGSFLPLLVTILRILVLLPSLVLVPFLDVFFLLIPFSMWRMMCAFQRYCHNTAGSPMASDKILKKYWMIKKLLQDLNRAIGLILCCCVSVSLPYYATWSAVTYFNENVHPVTLLHVYGFFIVFFVGLTLAADINKKGSEFYSWISTAENCEKISSKILTSLLVDLHSNQIALKGNGFFQISYRFLGTIFGVIVTYSIITIQIQLSRKGYENSDCNCSITNS